MNSELTVKKLNIPVVALIIFLHLFSFLAFLPMFFNWYNVIGMIVLLQITGGFGISIGYHRLLAHRAFFSFHPLMGFFHTLCGVLAFQMGPISWARIHRAHHKYTDSPKDPHNQNKGFFYVHLGWMLEKIDMSRFQVPSDLLRIKYVRLMEKYYFSLNAIFFIFLFFIGYFLGSLNPLGFEMNDRSFHQLILNGIGMMIWAGFLRIITLYHLTWSINSVCHRYGYQNFIENRNTGSSKNNLFIGYFSFGEGWHNNHHQYPYSAKFSFHWWEFDVSWLYIKLISKINLCKPKTFNRIKYIEQASLVQNSSATSHEIFSMDEVYVK